MHLLLTVLTGGKTASELIVEWQRDCSPEGELVSGDFLSDDDDGAHSTLTGLRGLPSQAGSDSAVLREVEILGESRHR